MPNRDNTPILVADDRGNEAVFPSLQEAGAGIRIWLNDVLETSCQGLSEEGVEETFPRLLVRLRDAVASVPVPPLEIEQLARYANAVADKALAGCLNDDERDAVGVPTDSRCAQRAVLRSQMSRHWHHSPRTAADSSHEHAACARRERGLVGKTTDRLPPEELGAAFEAAAETSSNNHSSLRAERIRCAAALRLRDLDDPVRDAVQDAKSTSLTSIAPRPQRRSRRQCARRSNTARRCVSVQDY